MTNSSRNSVVLSQRNRTYSIEKLNDRLKDSKIDHRQTLSPEPPSEPATRSWSWPVPSIPVNNAKTNNFFYQPNLDSTVSTGPDYLKLILTAKVYEAAIETPLHFAPKLSLKLGNKIYLKREDLQPIFSFKCRGAYNKISSLSPQQLGCGIICVSAGNHAQGVALAAKKLGIEKNCYVVMPKFAPDIKVDSVRRMGVNIILHGSDFDEAKQECFRLVQEHHYVFIPPYDDPLVIAGAGTCGVEILRQVKHKLDAIFICCGGGGLIAGIAAYVKRIYPDTKIIGVNTFDSDSMYQSLVAGKVVTLPSAGLFSDGTSIRAIGNETFRVCQQNVDDFVLVNTDEICAAIKDMFDESRTVLEPSGALGVAGMKKFLSANPEIKDGCFVAITSGANMNFERLRFVADRARFGEGKEVLLMVTISEEPGALIRFYKLIQPRVMTELSYRFAPPKKNQLFIALEIQNEQDYAKLEETMIKDPELVIGFSNITNNELAKAHVRYLIGGTSPNIVDEKLIRFKFQERPGSLLKFFNSIKNIWNISLFQYKYYGSDLARILMGIQVPPSDQVKFSNFLEKCGFPFVDETENPVYIEFLK